MGLVKRSHSGEEPAPCGSCEELTPRGSGEELTPCGSGEEVPHHILQCDLLLCCISTLFFHVLILSRLYPVGTFHSNNRVMTTQQPQ